MNVSFLYPQFLWAFTLLSIPIVIHLFNFRKYKEIYFPNIQFLKQIKEQSKSANQLKNLLLLLLRLLLFSALILAFAMPYSSRNNATKENTQRLHAFYVDNSFSMNATGESGPLLDQAKKQAADIVKNLPSSDYFMLTTNDFEGKHRRHLEKKEFLQELENIEESPSSKNTNEVYLRQQSDISSVSNSTLYWLSDFQKNTVPAKVKNIDSSLTLYLLPMAAAPQNNVSIDSCWFESPQRKLNTPEELLVKISNHGDKDLDNLPIKLTINGAQKAFTTVSIKANSQALVTLSYTLFKNGRVNGCIEINNHPIVFDNSFYFTYNIKANCKILHLYENIANPAYSKLFKKDSTLLFSQSSIEQLDYSILQEQDFIILDEIVNYSSGMLQEIARFSNGGGSLCIIPSRKNINANALCSVLAIDALGSSDSISSRLQEINMASDFFLNVFTKQEVQTNEKINFPLFSYHYKVTNDFLPGKEIMLRLLNNDPLLLRYRRNSSSIFLIAAPLDKNSSNFMQHALCVPTMYRMVLSIMTSGQLYQNLSSNLQIPLAPKESKGSGTYLIANDREEFALTASKSQSLSNLHAGNQIKKAGIYAITKDKIQIDAVALNYPRNESTMIFCSAQELQKSYGINAKNIHIIEQGEMKSSASALDALNKKDYWHHFIILAILLLGIEALLYRFW